MLKIFQVLQYQNSQHFSNLIFTILNFEYCIVDLISCTCLIYHIYYKHTVYIYSIYMCVYIQCMCVCVYTHSERHIHIFFFPVPTCPLNAYNEKFSENYMYCSSETKRLPDISSTKIGLLWNIRELQSRVCSHGEPHASPCTARENVEECFHRKEKEIVRAIVN